MYTDGVKPISKCRILHFKPALNGHLYMKADLYIKARTAWLTSGAHIVLTCIQQPPIRFHKGQFSFDFPRVALYRDFDCTQYTTNEPFE